MKCFLVLSSVLYSSISFSKPITISVDCGNISIELLEKGSLNTQIIQAGDNKPVVTLQDEQLTIKHLPKCNNGASISIKLPVTDSIDLQMGAGNLKIKGTSYITKTHRIKTSVSAGNIESQVPTIRTSRSTASMTAETDINTDKNFKAQLGAGNISFLP
ncbi:MAG: hypothetical protein AB8G05_04080 [Oligoflexales bacterium]